MICKDKDQQSNDSFPPFEKCVEVIGKTTICLFEKYVKFMLRNIEELGSGRGLVVIMLDSVL